MGAPVPYIVLFRNLNISTKIYYFLDILTISQTYKEVKNA